MRRRWTGAECSQEAGQKGTEIRVQYGTVRLNHAEMAELYGIVRNAVTKHIQNIYASGEQNKEATCSKMEQVANNGKTYRYLFYSLDMIIAVGYRVNKIDTDLKYGLIPNGVE